MLFAWLAASAALAFVAGLTYLSAACRERPRPLIWLVSSTVVAVAPCLVPVEAGPYRLFAAFVAIAILLKLYDQYRRPAPEALSPTIMARVIYLANWFWLVHSRRPAAVDTDVDRRRLAWLLPWSLLWITICVVVFQFEWRTIPFWCEHVTKSAVLALAVVNSTNCCAVAWRLCGGRALDPMVAPWLARTPLDTWRRWNRPTQQFLHEHVFLPFGGAKHPVRAILGTFFVSGLVHEYVLGIAAGRVQGWQLLFFSLQGAAAAASIAWRPRGWMVVTSVVLTLAFNLATLPLFGMSVLQLVPFYAARAP